MPTADWDELEPTAGTPGNAYELGLDVYMGAAWVNVPDITALNPQPQPKTRSRSSYAAKGQARPNTYARDLNLSVNVEVVRDALGAYQEELQYLLDKSFMLNEDNQVTIRVFDTLGADYAFEGVFTIEHSRPNTGDEDPGWFGFSLSSVGGVESIPNPAEELLPGIISVLPALAAVGDEVVIHGRNLDALTALTIDGQNAFASIQEVDARNIIATIPASVTGAAPVVPTNAEGAGPTFAYVAATA